MIMIIQKGDTYYAFIDIDKDGVDECVLRYGGTPDTAKDSGYGEATSLYTIKNGKVKVILENHKSFDPYCHMNYVSDEGNFEDIRIMEQDEKNNNKKIKEGE